MAEKNSLWKNIRKKAEQNRRTGAKPKKPTAEMLRQERKIKAKQYYNGGPTGNDEDDKIIDPADYLISKVIMNRSKDQNLDQTTPINNNEDGAPYKPLSVPMVGYELPEREDYTPYKPLSIPMIGYEPDPSFYNTPSKTETTKASNKTKNKKPVNKPNNVKSNTENSEISPYTRFLLDSYKYKNQNSQNSQYTEPRYIAERDDTSTRLSPAMSTKEWKEGPRSFGPTLKDLDVVTDVMQLGNFVPHPAGQLIGKLGSWGGAAIDSYQAYDDYNEGNYGSMAANIASAGLGAYLGGRGYRRDMNNTVPGSMADKIASFGSRSGSYRPLTALPKLRNNAVIQKGLNYNRSLLGGLGSETIYDSKADGGPTKSLVQPPVLLDDNIIYPTDNPYMPGVNKDILDSEYDSYMRWREGFINNQGMTPEEYYQTYPSRQEYDRQNFDPANLHNGVSLAQGGPTDGKDDPFKSTLNQGVTVAKPAQDWVSSWVQDPEFANRLNKNFPDHASKLSKKIYGYKEAKQRAAESNLKSINKAIPGVISDIYDTKFLYNTNPENNSQLLDLYRASYNDPEYDKFFKKTMSKNPQGFTDEQGRIVITNAANDQYGPESVSVHELMHKTGLYDNETFDRTFKGKFLTPSQDRLDKDFNRGEMYPFLMQMRFDNNFQPGEIITPERLKQIKESGYKNHLFKYYTDDEISKYLNTLASNQTQTPMQYAAQGGYMYDGGGPTKFYKKAQYDPNTGKILEYAGTQGNEYYVTPNTPQGIDFERRLPELEKIENTGLYNPDIVGPTAPRFIPSETGWIQNPNYQPPASGRAEPTMGPIEAALFAPAIASKAVPAVASTLQLPAVVGGRTIPLLTGNNILGLTGGISGANMLGSDINSGYYSSNAPWDEKLARGLETGLFLSGSPGVIGGLGMGLNTAKTGYRNYFKNNFSVNPNIPINPLQKPSLADKRNFALWQANEDAATFSQSPYNRKKLSLFRTNNEFNLSNQKARFANDPELVEPFNKYRDFKNAKESDPFKQIADNPKLYLEDQSGNMSQGKYGFRDFGDKDDIIVINPHLSPEDIYLTSMHETGHSRSIRDLSTLPTVHERKILDDAWSTGLKNYDGTYVYKNHDRAYHEAEAVQNELRMILNDKDGSRVYYRKDDEDIKNALQYLINQKHPYVQSVNDFDISKIRKSLNKIGFAGTTGVVIGTTMKQNLQPEQQSQGGYMNPYMYYAGGPMQYKTGGVLEDVGKLWLNYMASPLEQISGNNFVNFNYNNKGFANAAAVMEGVAGAGTDFAGSVFLPGYGIGKNAIQGVTKNLGHSQEYQRGADKWANKTGQIASSAGNLTSGIVSGNPQQIVSGAGQVLGTLGSEFGSKELNAAGQLVGIGSRFVNPSQGMSSTTPSVDSSINNFQSPVMYPDQMLNQGLSFAATGGNINNNSLNLQNSTMKRYKDYKTKYSRGGTFQKYGINEIPESAGYHHQNAYGGVLIGQDAMAEGGEFVLDNNYVVSDQVDGMNTQTDEFGRTMAQNLKRDLSKYTLRDLDSKNRDQERRPYSDISSLTIEQIKQNAIMETEKTRAEAQAKEQQRQAMVNGALQYAAAGGKLNKDITKIVEEEYAAAYGGYINPKKYKGLNMPGYSKGGKLPKEILRARVESHMSPQEADAYVNQYGEGGGIHIKESKRGTFTAAATKHGKSVQEFARQVLANKDNYSSAMVKKANFARNAAGWKHAQGGYTFGNETPEIIYPQQSMLYNIAPTDVEQPYVINDNQLLNSMSKRNAIISDEGFIYDNSGTNVKPTTSLDYNIDKNIIDPNNKNLNANINFLRESPKGKIGVTGSYENSTTLTPQELEEIRTQQAINQQKLNLGLTGSRTFNTKNDSKIIVGGSVNSTMQPGSAPVYNYQGTVGYSTPKGNTFDANISRDAATGATTGKVSGKIVFGKAKGGPIVSNVAQPFQVAAQNRGGMMMNYAMGGNMYAMGGPGDELDPEQLKAQGFVEQNDYWYNPKTKQFIYKNEPVSMNAPFANTIFNSDFRSSDPFTAYHGAINNPNYGGVVQGSEEFFNPEYDYQYSGTDNQGYDSWNVNTLSKSRQQQIKDYYSKNLTRQNQPVNNKDNSVDELFSENNITRKVNIPKIQPKQPVTSQTPINVTPPYEGGYNPETQSGYFQVDENGNLVSIDEIYRPKKFQTAPKIAGGKSPYDLNLDSNPMLEEVQRVPSIDAIQSKTDITELPPPTLLTPENKNTGPYSNRWSLNPQPESLMTDENGNVIAYDSAAQSFAYKPEAPPTKVNQPKQPNDGLGIPDYISMAAQAAGPLSQLYYGLKGPDDVNYQRVGAELIDPTKAIILSNEEARRAQDLAGYNLKQYAPTSGSFMSNTRGLGLSAGKQRAGMAAGLQAQADAANAEIKNRINQFNTQIAMQEQIDRLQERDAARTNVTEGLSGVGSSTANVIRDYRINQLNKTIANNIGTNNYKYDPITRELIYRNTDGSIIRQPLESIVGTQSNTGSTTTTTGANLPTANVNPAAAPAANTTPKSVNFTDNITDKKTGDAFRKWVNQTHPDYAKEKDLWVSGEYNNSYIKKAWDEYGKEYLGQ